MSTASASFALADERAGVRLLMSMPEIAELAGVKRPVVSTWRRRHPDFPSPAGGDAAQPLFDPHEVAEWLIDTGRADRAKIEPDLSLYALASMGTAFPAKELIASVTALICLRHLDDNEPLADGTDDVVATARDRAAGIDPDDNLLLSEIRQIPADAGWLAAAVDDLVEAAWGCPGAFERIMGARNRFKVAEISAATVTPELARLMAGLSGALERAARGDSITVTDPAAGTGDLLTAVADLLGPDDLPACTAAESGPYLARLMRRRLTVHGIPRVDMDIRTGDELPDESGDPDVIVTQIPYAPGEGRSPGGVLFKMSDISVRLAAGCSAVVLGPADVLVRALEPYSAAQDQRVALLKLGIVEAVIQLPGGLVPFRPGYETALWVLNSPCNPRGHGRALLVDISDRKLTDDVIDAVTEDVITWRRDGYNPDAHARVFGVQVRISDLVDPPRPLTVRRPRNIRTAESDAAASVARVLQLEADLDRVGAYATTVRGGIRSYTETRIQARPPALSIGRLAQDRCLAVLRGTRLDPSHVANDGNHEVLGPGEVLGLSRRGRRSIDRAILADCYPRAKLTEPGDVLVTTVPEFGAIIDDYGYGVAEFPVRILRIPDAGRARLTPRVLAALLAADRSGTRPAGAVRAGRRLEDHQVPLLSAEQVARLDALLAGIDARRAHAKEEIDLLDELGAITTTGVADGTLSLANDIPQPDESREGTDATEE